MPPEQRKLLRAIARSLPWALVAIVATAALCGALGVPRWTASILVPLAGLAVPVGFAYRDLRAMHATSRSRGTPLPGRLLAAAHVLLPLIGVPLAIEGLRSDNRAVAIVGTSLLAIVVVDSAVILPWWTAHRQKRERESRAR